MTGIAAIRVNDEKNVVDYSTDRLDSDLAIFTTIIQPLQCGIQEDARGVFEAEATFVVYALSVVGSRSRALYNHPDAKPSAAY